MFPSPLSALLEVGWTCVVHARLVGRDGLDGSSSLVLGRSISLREASMSWIFLLASNSTIATLHSPAGKQAGNHLKVGVQARQLCAAKSRVAPWVRGRIMSTREVEGIFSLDSTSSRGHWKGVCMN